MDTVEVVALPPGGFRVKGFVTPAASGGGEALGEEACLECPLIPSLNSTPDPVVTLWPVLNFWL